MAKRRPEEMISLMTKLMMDEGCVTISPKEGPFRDKQRSFLDGIRRVPVDITCPPGVDPFSAALGRPGRWLFVWIPE